MTIMIVDGRRIGETKCSYCRGDVTLAELAVGTAWVSTMRVNGDSAFGHEVAHNKCAADAGARFIGSAGQWITP